MSSARIEFESKLSDLFVRILHIDVEEVSRIERDNSPQWDSLVHLDLVFAAEELAGKRLDPLQIAFIGNFKELVDAFFSSETP